MGNLLPGCDVLRDFVRFVQFKKREKHQQKFMNLHKVTIPSTGVFR